MKSNMYFPNEDIRNVHLHQVVMVVVVVDADRRSQIADRFVNLMKIVKCRSTNTKFNANASVSSSFILDHNTQCITTIIPKCSQQSNTQHKQNSVW